VNKWAEINYDHRHSFKAGRAALNFAADTGWDTDQLWAPKWRRIVYVGCENC